MRGPIRATNGLAGDASAIPHQPGSALGSQFNGLFDIFQLPLAKTGS